MRPPRKFIADERHENWERIGASESPSGIARSTGRNPSAVRSRKLATDAFGGRRVPAHLGA